MKMYALVPLFGLLLIVGYEFAALAFGWPTITDQLKPVWRVPFWAGVGAALLLWLPFHFFAGVRSTAANVAVAAVSFVVAYLVALKRKAD